MKRILTARILAGMIGVTLSSVVAVAQPAVAQPAVAQPAGGPSAQSAPNERVDPRIRIVNYSPNRIIPLRGHLGYQMLIEFDPAERIENVAIGDSLAWQVTPNRAATMLFLKPVVAGSATNMTVITSLRRYSFDLRALEPTGPSDPAIIYTVRFNYPQPAVAPVVAAPRETPRAAPPRPLNTRYSMRGGDHFRGVRVFDDGVMTYFQIPADVETPAIFVVDQRGDEELVNTQAVPPYVVVDHLARSFVLRSGRHKTRVQNDAYGRTGGLSPQLEGPAQ